MIFIQLTYKISDTRSKVYSGRIFWVRKEIGEKNKLEESLNDL